MTQTESHAATPVVSQARIYVPQPIVPEALQILESLGSVEVLDTDRMPTRDELMAALGRNDYALIIGDLPIPNDVLEANRHLKGLAFALTMPEPFIDLELASSLGIPVTKVAVFSWIKSTAELTMTLVLALHWRLVEADRWTRCGRFRQEMSIHFLCTSIENKILGMIGLGRVARLVVPLARAFGFEVIYTKRTRLDAADEESLGVRWVEDLDELLATSDVVSVHADANKSTHGLLGEREFALMKPTAYLVNTARGWILDEDALVSALRDGQIAGAGLDVFTGEPPYMPDVSGPHPGLCELRNVILLPHIGGQTDRVMIDMTVDAAKNLSQLIRGERPPGLMTVMPSA